MKEIIIDVDSNNKKSIILLENGIVVERYYEQEQDNRIEGNIYLGRVKDVLPGLQAAFIDIGEDKNTFIHLKDILPKIDEKKQDVAEGVNQDIKKVVKQGDVLLVQVKRDGTNKKGARVSTHVNLPGSYSVLLPDAPFITVSQKIEDEQEKARLIGILKEALPKNYGAIIRTSALKKEAKVIQEDIEHLVNQWNMILKGAEESENVPRMLYKSYSVVEKILLDLTDQSLEKIVVNDKKLYDEIKQIIDGENIKGRKGKLTIQLSKENLLEMYDIKKQLERVENRKVWLKCGGFITIDKTEALTAIDVNSGKYIGNKSLEDTVFEVNKEASIEIAKQLRLRDIGGIIIIDYIDMQNEEHKQKIIGTLKEYLKKDRSKTQIVGFSKLNLLEMTRKHIYSPED